MKMNNQLKALCVILSMILISNACSSHENADHTKHQEHFDKVNEQGDTAMGFSHKETKHQFILLKDGGVIQVSVNNIEDTENLNKIRKHLNEIPTMFSAGNFEDPMATHGKIPPGVPTMKELKTEIEYNYQEIEKGGRVRISTKNEEALKAIHSFLRFQIEDHQTGNSNEIINELN